jgi:hypothetical protein
MTEHTTPQNTDPVAMIDRVGRTWGRDLIGGIDGSVGLCFRHPDVAQAHPLEELRERYGPLSEVYAHPPVTAEPAPSACGFNACPVHGGAAEPVPACSDWPGACQHTPAHDNGKLTPEYAESAPPRLDMYEPEDGVAEIDGVLWVPSKDLDAMREEEEAAAAAQQTRLEALRRSHEFIAVHEPEAAVSAKLLLSSVRWVLTGQVDE